MAKSTADQLAKLTERKQNITDLGKEAADEITALCESAKVTVHSPVTNDPRRTYQTIFELDTKGNVRLVSGQSSVYLTPALVGQLARWAGKHGIITVDLSAKLYPLPGDD